jgi:hypothetical protein
MITFPATYTLNPQSFVQGPTRLWYAPYIINGADPAQNTIVAAGSLDKAGIEFDHKPTYTETEVDQLTTPVDAFMTKQEFDLKFNLFELSPTFVNVVLGMPAASLVVGGGTSTQNLGEPFDVLAGANPSMRPQFRAFMFQFPSPGHDNTTSPIGAWGYMHFFKAYVQTHGGIKFSKDGQAMVSVTVRALADPTVSGAYKVGKIISQ